QVVRAAITIAVTDVRHLGNERLETAALGHLAGSKREGPHRAAVGCALKGDDWLAGGGGGGPSCRRLHWPGPRSGTQEPFGGFSGRNFAKLFRQIAQGRIIEVGAANMDEPGRLFLNRLYHARMAMPRGTHGDTRSEIEIQIAVHVLEQAAVATLDRQ